ncbi:Sentrin-specific protease 2 [Desmophyllum pertusum]|uniref:Sentrin-specific protease 2 n=1 Tax=Desmophyllum pertusum TaxID=174260 RepID=A0A9W9ZCG3_9CNID|nr:Sentrin-specific protease 2 [Desmophyllum pertusum]
MNNINSISSESLRRFQQWRPGLKDEECWLNDEGINTYNALLARKFHSMINLLGKEAWVIPINERRHWKVMIVNLVKKTICLYDSIAGNRSEGPTEKRHFLTVRHFVESICNISGKKWIPHEWKQENCTRNSKAVECVRLWDFFIEGELLRYVSNAM